MQRHNPYLVDEDHLEDGAHVYIRRLQFGDVSGRYVYSHHGRFWTAPHPIKCQQENLARMSGEKSSRANRTMH